MMNESVTRQSNPVMVSFIVSIAAFMEVLDTTIANVSLSHIAGSIGASADESTWVLTSYLVANAIILPISGWLSDMMGRKNFFMLCISGFTLTSFLCGISNSLTMLIIFRMLQGLTGGGLQPVQQAIIKDSFPPEKLGMAFAITGVTTVLAPIIGPVLGGYITDNYRWRWIFLMNIPIGILATFLVNMFVEDPPTAKKKEFISIDYIGLSLIALGLGALQIMLDKGQQEDWFSSTLIIVLFILTVIGLVGSAFWLLKQKNPVVDLKLLAIPSFALPCIIMFFVGFSLYGSSTILPMLVQSCFGYNSTTSGLVLSPAGVAVVFVMPMAGRLINKVSAKYLISFGLFLTAFGLWFTGHLTPQTDYATFVFMRIVQMIGLPFLFVASSTLAFSKIAPKDSGNASAIISLMRNIGGGVGIATVTSLLTRYQQTEQSNLVQHLTFADQGYTSALSAYTNTITSLGTPSSQASSSALGQIYQQLMLQSSILAYRDVYNLVALMLLILAFGALLMPNNEQKKKESPEMGH